MRAGLKGGLELYNLKDDLAESNNLAAKNPEMVRKFEAMMAAAHVDSKDFAIRDVRGRNEITVSRGVLAKYTGTYELRPGVDLVIALEGDQLMAQAAGQSKVPFFAESETRFFLKVADVQVEFFQDEKGVARLTMRQGGRDISAVRK